MKDLSDLDLLREFATRNSEPAFAELVQRHVNLVYSVAGRITRNFGDAQDVTQAVFIILARKAGVLRAGTVVSGWLYETARFTAMRLLRSQRRRRAHEQEASMQPTFEESGDDLWRQLAPHLETAMSRLSERDRALLVLRYYENKTGADAASLLGIQEETARKRTNRALEKLRVFFSRQGISSSTTVIASTFSAYAVQPAPAGLVKGATAVALAKGATASLSTLALSKGGISFMAWTNTKTAIAVSVGILLAAGTTTLAVREISKHREKAVWDSVTRIVRARDLKPFKDVPEAVAIRKTKFYPQVNDGYWEGFGGKILGMAVPTAGVFGHAYDVNRTRFVNSELLPAGRYDFVVTLHTNQHQALQAEARELFGIVGRKVTRDADVFLLRIAQTNAPGLQVASGTGPARGPYWSKGSVRYDDTPLSYLCYTIERAINVPVINDADPASRYDIAIKWGDDRREPGLDVVKQVLREQLGIELVSTNMPLEMLELAKVK